MGLMKVKLKLTGTAKRVVVCLLLPVLMAGILTYLFALWSNRGIFVFQPPKIVVSPGVTETTVTVTGSPGYFHSTGILYVAISSPYIRSFEGLSFNMSLDGINWSEIHPYSRSPEVTNKSAFTSLGYVDVSQLNIVIHLRYLIPPQDLHDLPPGISGEDALNSFNGSIVVDVMTTPGDWIAFFLCWIALSGFFFGIINVIYPTERAPPTQGHAPRR